MSLSITVGTGAPKYLPVKSAPAPAAPDAHVYETIDHLQLTRATPEEAAAPAALAQQLEAHLGAYPSVRTTIAVAPNGPSTLLFISGQSDAVQQSQLDGAFEVVARLASSPSLKDLASKFPSQRFEVSQVDANTTRIELSGAIDETAVAAALSDAAPANDYAGLQQLVEDLPKGQRVAVLLEGPSAAGKTTLIKKIQEFAGQRPVTSVTGDNNFLDHDDPKYPRTENGGFYFDSVAAIDLDRLKTDLSGLISTGQAELPLYNWKDQRPGVAGPNKLPGFRESRTEHKEAGPDDIVVLDSIHAGNKIIVDELKAKNIPFRIIYLDSERAEDRLQRRMVRDERERSLPAQAQLEVWQQSTRRGEIENIKPSLLNLDPEQDTFLKLKFDTDLGLSEQQLDQKAQQLQQFGLQTSNAALASPDLAAFARSEHERLLNLVADPNTSDSDRQWARKGLEKLQLPNLPK